MQNYTYKTIFINCMPCSYYAYIIKHKIIFNAIWIEQGKKIKVVVEID